MEGRPAAAVAMVPGLVSIVIPCYNGLRFLPQAIESCLRQTYRDLEVIVVDDASPDDCAAIAERYASRDDRVRVIRRPANGGVSRAFNTGFEAARGEYFAAPRAGRRVPRGRHRADDRPAPVASPMGPGVLRQPGDRRGGRGHPAGADARPRRGARGRQSRGPLRHVAPEGLGRDRQLRPGIRHGRGLRILAEDPARPSHRQVRGRRPLLLPQTRPDGLQPVRAAPGIHPLERQVRHSGNRGEARRLKGGCYAEVAYIHRAHGRFAQAIYCAAVSTAYWPFSTRCYRVAARTLLDAGRMMAGRLSRGLRRSPGARIDPHPRPPRGADGPDGQGRRRPAHEES